MYKRCAKSPLVMFCLVSVAAYCASFELHFSAIIENDANDVFPDSFSVFGHSDFLPDDLTTSLLYHPPGPPSGNYLQIYNSVTNQTYSRLSQKYDPNEVDLQYSMILKAFDAQSGGLSGNCIIELTNPAAMLNLPPDCLVYIRRFDHQGTFLQSYDLSDPDNHTFQWPVAEVSGLFAQLDFLVVDRCLAADLMMNDTIDLSDYAVLARNWNQDAGVIDGDIFLDAVVDMKDLSILAEKWLCSCQE